MIRIVTNKYFLILVSVLAICTGCLGIWIIPPLITPAPLPPEEEAQPNWSPDGQLLTYVCYLEGPTDGYSQFDYVFDINPPKPKAPWLQYTDQAADICIIDLDERNRTRLTYQIGKEWHPIWSPDGTTIAYLQSDGIYIVNTDSGNRRRIAPSNGVRKDSLSWSPDGNQLLFSACQDNLDADIYMTDIENGLTTNLTSNSREQDIAPQWILNGTQIFFLSTTSSVWQPCDLKNDAPHQMKVINTDGSEERKIYKELYYPFVAASSTGQIAFVSDLISKTDEEYWAFSEKPSARLYAMGINGSDLIEIPTQGKTLAMFRPIVYAWSPDSNYLLHIDQDRKFKIWDKETGEVRDLPPIEQLFAVEEYPELSDFSWSSDGQRIAATVHLTKGGDENGGDNWIYFEKHIYVFDLQHNTVHPLIQK